MARKYIKMGWGLYNFFFWIRYSQFAISQRLVPWCIFSGHLTLLHSHRLICSWIRRFTQLQSLFFISCIFRRRKDTVQLDFVFSYIGTIAPARGIPGDGKDSSEKDMNGDHQLEDTLKYFLTNVNLIVPVVAAVAVIVIAIAVICVLRGRQTPPPGFKPGNSPLMSFSSFFRPGRTRLGRRRWLRRKRRPHQRNRRRRHPRNPWMAQPGDCCSCNRHHHCHLCRSPSHLCRSHAAKGAADDARSIFLEVSAFIHYSVNQNTNSLGFVFKVN